MVSHPFSDCNIHAEKFWSDVYASEHQSHYASYVFPKFNIKINIEWFENNHWKMSISSSSVLYCWFVRVSFNSFLTNVPILYYLKTPQNQMFSGIFKVYKMGTLTENDFMFQIDSVLVLTMKYKI